MRRFRISVNGQSYEVEVEELSSLPASPAAAGNMRAVPEGAVAGPHVETGGGTHPAQHTSADFNVSDPPAPLPEGEDSGEQVRAPLPGVVLDLKKQPGEPVAAGEVLLILEAMKMENEITSPVDGMIGAILVEKGQPVNMGDLLAVIQA